MKPRTYSFIGLRVGAYKKPSIEEVRKDLERLIEAGRVVKDADGRYWPASPKSEDD